MHRLTGRQSADLYELIISRHRVSSFVMTSNRAVEAWLSIFDDPILGNSALDRLANASYQIVIEGASYRERLSPHRKLLGNKEGIDSLTTSRYYSIHQAPGWVNVRVIPWVNDFVNRHRDAPMNPLNAFGPPGHFRYLIPTRCHHLTSLTG